MKRLDDSMPGIFEKAAKYLTEDKIKVGDKITWNEHPRIKSTVERIERSRFTNDKMYVCTNGCRFQINEIKKVQS